MISAPKQVCFLPHPWGINLLLVLESHQLLFDINPAQFQTRSSLPVPKTLKCHHHITPQQARTNRINWASTWSYLICPDSDYSMIMFRSSDLEYFSLGRKDIEAHTGALIPGSWRPRSVVDLAETATILRMLFQFIGAHKHPKLLNEKFEILAELAKAAEKYKVYSAMNTCSERMRYVCDHTHQSWSFNGHPAGLSVTVIRDLFSYTQHITNILISLMNVLHALLQARTWSTLHPFSLKNSAFLGYAISLRTDTKHLILNNIAFLS